MTRWRCVYTPYWQVGGSDTLLCVWLTSVRCVVRLTLALQYKSNGRAPYWQVGGSDTLLCVRLTSVRRVVRLTLALQYKSNGRAPYWQVGGSDTLLCVRLTSVRRDKKKLCKTDMVCYQSSNKQLYTQPNLKKTLSKIITWTSFFTIYL